MTLFHVSEIISYMSNASQSTSPPLSSPLSSSPPSSSSSSSPRSSSTASSPLAAPSLASSSISDLSSIDVAIKPLPPVSPMTSSDKSEAEFARRSTSTMDLGEPVSSKAYIARTKGKMKNNRASYLASQPMIEKATASQTMTTTTKTRAAATAAVGVESSSSSRDVATSSIIIGGTKKFKSTYKHVPHSLKPAHLVAKRNARERTRVQAVNSAFGRLRKHVPCETTNRHKRLSKVKTLRLAIEYIHHLQALLLHDERSARSSGCVSRGDDTFSGGDGGRSGRHLAENHSAVSRARRRAKISDSRFRPPSPFPIISRQDAASDPGHRYMHHTSGSGGGPSGALPRMLYPLVEAPHFRPPFAVPPQEVIPSAPPHPVTLHAATTGSSTGGFLGDAAPSQMGTGVGAIFSGSLRSFEDSCRPNTCVAEYEQTNSWIYSSVQNFGDIGGVPQERQGNVGMKYQQAAPFETDSPSCQRLALANVSANGEVQINDKQYDTYIPQHQYKTCCIQAHGQEDSSFATQHIQVSHDPDTDSNPNGNDFDHAFSLTHCRNPNKVRHVQSVNSCDDFSKCQGLPGYSAVRDIPQDKPRYHTMHGYESLPFGPSREVSPNLGLDPEFPPNFGLIGESSPNFAIVKESSSDLRLNVKASGSHLDSSFLN